MKKDYRIGEVYMFESGHTMTILEYYSVNNISVLFCDGYISYNIEYPNFKKGKVKNFNIPSFYGIGYLSYGKYNTLDNKIAYERWKSMISRCYSDKFQSKTLTYLGCSVNPEWHNFQVFAKWFDKNYVEGFELDKDILVKGNKVYGPETCCFVPRDINVFFASRKRKRGDFVVGVSKYKNKFITNISLNGIQKNLGYYYTEIEAFNVYKIAKELKIKELANKFKHKITNKCYSALINWTLEIND